MPFPFKKKPSEEIGSPEPMEKIPMGKGHGGMGKRMMASKPAPEMAEESPEGEVSAHASKIVAAGEQYGLSPEESKAFAKTVLESCMSGLGGEDEVAEETPETNEGETEEVA